MARLIPWTLLDKGLRRLGEARELLSRDPLWTGAELDLAERPDAADDSAIIGRVARAYALASEEQARIASGPYVVAGAWRDDIEKRRGDWIRGLRAGDVKTLQPLFKDFLRNSGVAGLWDHAYFADVAGGGARARRAFLLKLFKGLRLWTELVEGDKTGALEVPPIGNPWGARFDGTLVTANSLRHHYYAYRLSRLLEGETAPVVCEIGGGFGGFAYYLMKRNVASYVEFDIPEILAMATYYLLKAFPERRFLLYGEAPIENIDRGLLRGYDAVLLPHFALRRLAPGSIDVAINTCSFSEMDLATVQEYLDRLSVAGTRWLFHVNSDQAALNSSGHIEIPASRFPIPKGFRLIYKMCNDLDDRTREYLYQRI